MTNLKDLLPRRLYQRSLLIILLPVALMQIVVTYGFFDSHWRQTSRKLAESVAGDIAFIIQLYEADPTRENLDALIDTAWRTTRLSVRLREGETLPTARRSNMFSLLDQVMQRQLAAAIERPYWFDATRYPDYVDIRVQLDEGVLRVLAYRDRAFVTTGGIFVIWLIGVTGLLTAVSVIFIRNQVRPIQNLAEAADRFGRGLDAPDFKPSGATEVRQAASAVIEMRNRILRHADQRTAMLASISHDLRTPVTRLKLSMALMPKGAETEAAQADLVEMEAMLEGYLAFARGEEGEQPEPMSLSAVASGLCSSLSDGAGKLVWAGADDIAIHARPLAIRRALTNLINNARDHANRVEVKVEETERWTEVSVDDDGPGIEPDRYEEAFRPFARLDPARNQNASGVGLGLAIARDIARSHGGDIILDRSPLGGLRAKFRLPVSRARRQPN